MNQSRKILTAAALTGMGLIVTGLVLSPSTGGARGVDGSEDFAMARITSAFEAAAQVQVTAPADLEAAVLSRKGDLGAVSGCAGQMWPEISAQCLISADGSTTRPVRTVTIGYQTGDATTVLVRMPAPEIASR